MKKTKEQREKLWRWDSEYMEWKHDWVEGKFHYHETKKEKRNVFFIFKYKSENRGTWKLQNVQKSNNNKDWQISSYQEYTDYL